MKYGISTGAWYSYPFHKLINVIHDCGFNAISIGSKKQHSFYHTKQGKEFIRNFTRQSNMVIDSIHSPHGNTEEGVLDISDHDKTVRQRAIKETKVAIDAASDLHCKYVVVHPIGMKLKNDNLIEKAKYALDSLTVLQNYANTRSVHLALENLDKPESIMFDMLFEYASDIGFVFCYDSGHAMVDAEPKECWDKMKHLVKVLHLHDNNGKMDTHDAIGTGVFPWNELSKWLNESGFNGVISLECKFRGKTENEFHHWLMENLNRIINVIEQRGNHCGKNSS